MLPPIIHFNKTLSIFRGKTRPSRKSKIEITFIIKELKLELDSIGRNNARSEFKPDKKNRLYNQSEKQFTSYWCNLSNWYN